MDNQAAHLPDKPKGAMAVSAAAAPTAEALGTAPRGLPGVAPHVSRFGELGVLGTSLLVIGSIPALPIALGALAWRAYKAKDDSGEKWRTFFMALVAYVVLIFVPVRRRPGLMRSPLFRWWLEYMSVRVAFRSGEPLPQSGHYLFLMLPHGLYPFSGACAGISPLQEVFGGGMITAVAPIGTRIPIVRNLMAWIGCIGASFRSMDKALGEGSNVALFPGGVGEMMRTNPTCERLVLKGRQGFVKLALRHGVSIVPVYTFGNSVLWSHWPLPDIIERLSRWLRISVILPYGRFGQLLPRKLPLLYAFGEPIRCPKVEGPPTAEQVEATQKAVVDAVRDVYDFYKGCYGWEKRPLYIE